MAAAASILLIIWSTKVVSILLQNAAKTIVAVAVRKTSESGRLRREAVELKEELAGINAQDEFSQYARVQRKLSKVKESLKNSTTDDQTFVLKYKWLMKAAVAVASALVHIVAVWCFWSEVVMTVPADSVYPLAPLVAFPVGESGDVGASVWTLACSQAFDLAYNVLESTVTQISARKATHKP